MPSSTACPFLPSALGVLLLAACLPPTANAQRPPFRAEHRVELELPLERLLDQSGPLRLEGSASQHVLYVPIPARFVMRSAALHLEHSSSVSLLEGRSALSIEAGGTLAAQLPLRPDGAAVAVEVALPVAELRPGSVVPLRLGAIHVAPAGASAGPAGELWTRIDTRRSRLLLKADLRPLAPTLAQLPELLAAGLEQEASVTIAIPEQAREAHWAWGALAAQGVALRARERPLLVQAVVARRSGERLESRGPDGGAPWPSRFPGLDQAPLRGGDTILVGNALELGPYVASELLAEIHDAYLGIFPLDEDPARFVLLVSGPDDAAVTRAATALSFLSLPFPDTASTTIRALELPDCPPAGGHNAVQAGRTARFSELGLSTTSLRGTPGRGIALQLFVPPELPGGGPDAVELSLHLAYGAGLQSGSALNVHLNGVFENVVPLPDFNGGMYRDYKIQLSRASLRAGLNTILFEPVLLRATPAEAASAAQAQAVPFTLFEDSSVTMPEAAQTVMMPQLGLLARCGFPFADPTDGSGLELHLLATDPDTLSAAWMLMARLAQLGGFPLLRARITAAPARGDRDLIVLGPLGMPSLPAAAAGVPWLDPASAIPHAAAPRAQGDTSPGSLVRLLGRMGQGQGKRPEIAAVSQPGRLGRYTALVERESPFTKGRTLLALVADEPGLLRRGVRALVSSGVWGALDGDLALWHEESGLPITQSVAEPYPRGATAERLPERAGFTHVQWLWLGFLLVFLAGFARLTISVLDQYSQRHHATGGPGRAEV
jgi:cellulose synthase operon protein B